MDKPVLSTPSTKGPGKLRKLQAITGDPNSFITRNPETRQEKKKILLCYPLQDTPSLGEISILSELIEHYEVYLWEGPEKNLAAASPLTSAAEFWKQREKIKVDYESNIKEQLARQQIPADEWHILDYQGWEARWDSPPHIFHLDFKDLKNEDRHK